MTTRLHDLLYSTWPPEKAKLVELIHVSPGKYVVEIGCFQGFTSKVMLETCQQTGKELICIDPFDFTIGSGFGNAEPADTTVYQTFLENIAGGNVRVIKKPSHESGPDLPPDIYGNLAVVFIDGNHLYPHPFWDMTLFWPLVAQGGAMIMHDVWDKRCGRHVTLSIDEFLDRQPRGLTVNYMRYLPTPEEEALAQHGVSGLAWIVK